MGILANRLLVWSTIAFCRATIFEFQKFNSTNAGTSASPQFSIPNTYWDYKICIFAVPFLGPKNGPIFGAASYNSNKDGPIWRPQNWSQKLQIFGQKFDFLVPRVISCSPFQAPTLVCCLLFEVSMLVPLWGQLWRTMVSRASSSLPTLASSRSKRQALRLPMIFLSASVVLPGLSGNRGVCAPEPTSKSSVLQLPDGKVC